MAAYLPDARGGYLPYWQLLTGATATWMALQCLMGTKQMNRLFRTVTVTPVHGRTFAVWNLLAATVRIAHAYDVTNKTVYWLTFGTYAIAFFHFMSEFLVFRTITLSGPSIAPMVVASSALVWMWNQAGFYL